MRKYIILFILLLTATICFSQNYTEQDKAIFEKYKSQFQEKKEHDFNELVTQTALFFLGTPYTAHTLEIEPEALTVNLSQLDCTTFVETVLALSQTIKAGDPTFQKFMTQLQTVRYRTGTIEDYTSRIHYTSEWIAQNEKRKIVKNITRENGGKEIYFTLNIISSNPERYKQLKNNEALIQKIRESEIKASAHQNYYISKTEIEARGAELNANCTGFKNGDIVAFVTTVKGLDISHIGFIYREQDRLTFIHASSSEKRVVVEKLTLEQYALRSKSNKGIMVARPLFSH